MTRLFSVVRFGLARNSVAVRAGEMSQTRTTRVRDRRKRTHIASFHASRDERVFREAARGEAKSAQPA